MAAALLLLPVLPLVAQANLPKTSVDASLLGRRIAVGQGATFIVHVANGQPETLPREIAATGLKVTYQGYDSKGKRDSSGQQLVDYYYYYTAVGEASGTFTIPSIPVKVRGTEYKTNPVELVVYEPSADDLSLNASQPYFLRLKLHATELYEHQIAPVDLAAFARGRGALQQMSAPQIGDSEFVMKPFSRAENAETVDIDGWEYSRATISSAAFPIRAGQQTLGPIEMNCRIEKSVSRNSPGFRSIFTHSESVTMTSNPVTIQVKPLPSEGRPADFADTVGRFELQASATPTEVKVGDPISVDIVVSGVGNFDNVPAPTFHGGDARLWRTYEPRRTQDPTQTSDGVTPGRVTFTQIVIPQTEATALPEFTLSFFDPETASYQTLSTAPIALQVEADSTPAAVANAAAAGGATSPAPPGGHGIAMQPTATLTDILTIKTATPSWTGAPADLTQRWYFWAPQVIPAAVLMLLVGGTAAGFVRRRLGQRSDADKRASFAALCRGLESDEVQASRSLFFHHLQRCLDAWRHEQPNGEQRLPAAAVARLNELEANIHSVLYSGASVDRDSAPSAAEISQAKALLEELATSLR